MYIFVYTFVKLISTMKKHLLILATALLSISTFAQIPSYVPANGLVGWWPFNGNANDESGNGNHGTVNGATLTTDRFGNANMAYGFDGVDDWIEATFNQNNNYSISTWFKPNSSIPNYYGIFQHKDNCTRGAGFIVEIQNNYNLRFQATNCGQCGNICPNYFDELNIVNLDTTWQHLVLTSNFNGIYKLYLNGSIIHTTNNLSTISQFNVPFSIGKHHDGVDLFYFKGLIDDVGYWYTILSECEIQDLYHAQLGSQAISAGADQSICSGDPVTLNGAGGSNYQWNNNVVDGQAFTPNQSANYVLNGTDSLGCQGTDTVVVTVLENATSTLTQTALDSYTLNGQTYTQSGTYMQTLTAANGCDSTITLNLTLNFTGMDELGTGAKKLVKITDLNGKIIPRRKNTLMLFIYEDGTVERVVEIEE